MLKAIESELYRISISEDYDDTAIVITIKDTYQSITIFKNELDELINLLEKSNEVF